MANREDEDATPVGVGEMPLSEMSELVLIPHTWEAVTVKDEAVKF